MSIKKVILKITDKSYGFLMMEKYNLSRIFKKNNEEYDEEKINEWLDKNTIFNRSTLNVPIQTKKIIATFYAISRNKLSLLQDLTKNGFNNDKVKNDFLNFASQMSDLEIVKHLLSFFDIKNLDGTPLALAIAYSNEKVINYLLDRGDKSYQKESNVLLSAIVTNNIPLTNFLLNNDCAINLKDPTLFRTVIDWEDEKIIRKLIFKGIDLFVYDNEVGSSTWSNLISEGNFEVLKIINECGLDLKVKDEYFLKYCCLRGKGVYIEIMKYLIEHGSDIHIGKEYCLLHAAQKNNDEVVLFLLNKGANIEKSKLMIDKDVSKEMKEKINKWSELQKLNESLNTSLIINNTTTTRKKL